MSDTRGDRYISFAGLECDRNAAAIIAVVRAHLGDIACDAAWARYFAAKFAEQQRMATDDLFFVGSQLNNLYAFFAAVGDDTARQLLYLVEQECC